MTALKGKWLVVTNKECKAQDKREVERIFKGVTLQIMYPTYTQPGTIAKEHHNPTLVTYAAALQAAAENGPEITNVATPRQSKRNCIVLFDVLDIESYPRLPQKKKTIIKMIKRIIHYQIKQEQHGVINLKKPQQKLQNNWKKRAKLKQKNQRYN